MFGFFLDLEVYQIFSNIVLLYIKVHHVIHVYFVTYYNPPTNCSLYFTSALNPQVWLKLACFTVNLYWTFYLNFCFLRRTCRSGGCPVGPTWRLWAMHWSWTTSRGRLLSISAPPPNYLELLNSWVQLQRVRVPLETDSESVSLFQVSNLSDNFTPKPEELWGFRSKAAVYLRHINKKPKVLDQKKRPK